MKRFFLYGIPKSLLFKIILGLVILLIGQNVFAQDFNVSTSNITSPNSSGTGKYTGTEIMNSGTANVYNIGTRYNGQLSRIVFNLSSGGYADPEGFEKGHTYTLTMNMATEDWRNKFGSVSVKCDGSSGTELSNGKVTFVSYKKIKFSFTAPTNRYCQFVYIDLKSTNLTSTAFTGVSNWDLSSLVITDPAYCSGSECYSPPSSAPTGATSQDIINSNNSNTNNIIKNDDKNTNNIIENNTSNTQDIIENNNANADKVIEGLTDSINFSSTNELNAQRKSANSTCKNYYDFEISYGKKGLSNSGAEVDTNSNNFYTPKYININIVSTSYGNSIRVLNPSQTVSGYRIYFYDSSYNFISYVNLGTRTITLPTNAQYFKFVSPVSNTYIYRGGNCTTAADEVNDTIKNDNIDNGVGSNFFNDFSSNDTGGISGIITKPLVLINALLSNNNSCSALTFGIKFPNIANKNVSLPSGCILWNNVPSNVVNIYQMFIVGFCSYYLLKRLFKDVEDLKNPEKDNVEVIDL